MAGLSLINGSAVPKPSAEPQNHSSGQSSMNAKATDKPPMKKRKLILKIGVSLCFLGVMLYFAGLKETLEQLSKANLSFIPVGVGLYLLSQLISAFRWKILAKALDFRLSLREYFDYYLMGMYFSLFLPGSIGGDIGRVYYLAKSQNRKKRDALLTLLAERGTGLVTILLIVAGLCLTPQAALVPMPVRVLFWGLATTMIVGFLLLQALPVKQLTQRFLDTPYTNQNTNKAFPGRKAIQSVLQLLSTSEIYWKNIPLMLISIGLSCLVQILLVLIHLLIAAGLGITIDPVYLTLTYGIVGLMSILPIFFNGIGIREGGYQYFLVKVGVVSSVGLAFGLYWFAISLSTSLIGGLVFIRGHYQTPPEQFEDSE